MDCMVCLCFWAPRHSLPGPSKPPRAGAISFWGDCLPAPAALQWRMAISMNREKTLEECKRHIDECAALLERISARAAVRLSGVRPTARRYQTGLLFSGSVPMTEKNALRINGESKLSVTCSQTGHDRTH